jgi:protoheme IX farnesyltransferase
MTTAEFAHRGIIRSGSIISSLFLVSRPGILMLVALAGFCGMVMAEKGIPDRQIFTITLLCLLLSAAGSVMINSVLDYHLDRKMVRLQARVGAMNLIGRNRVMLLACAMITVSLVAAALYLNVLASFMILAAVVFYVGPYTLWLKRNSPYGVVPGGVPGALPVLIGYAAVAGDVRPEALLLFLIVFLWQPPHFWIYALKHREDYLNSGVPVMPAAKGAARTRLFILLHATALLPASVTLGFFAHFSIWYQTGAVLLGMLFIASCLLHVIKRPLFSLAFRISIFYLFFLFLVIIMDITFFRNPAVGG